MSRLGRIEAAHVDSLTFVPFLTDSEVDPVVDALAAIPGLLAIARAADAFLSVPRKVEYDTGTGLYVADHVPQQQAREVLAKALEDFEAGQ